MPPALSDDEMSDDNGPDSIPAKGKIPTKEEEIAAAEDDEEDDEEDEDGEEYRVELIRKHRFAGGRLEYQVKWLGYEKVADMTWEPIENLDNAPEAVTAYHKSIGGPPEAPKKGGKGKRSASTAFDSPVPDSSAKKTKGRQSDVGAANGTPAKKTLPAGTWENDVQRVTSILEEPEDPTQKNKSNVLIGLLEWIDGTKTQHKMDALRRKCPQKLLDYYEQHLVFKNDSLAED